MTAIRSDGGRVAERLLAAPLRPRHHDMSRMPVCDFWVVLIGSVGNGGRGVGGETPSAYDRLVCLDIRILGVVGDARHLVLVAGHLGYQDQGSLGSPSKYQGAGLQVSDVWGAGGWDDHPDILEYEHFGYFAFFLRFVVVVLRRIDSVPRFGRCGTS
jgi:hypothetical protein